MDFTLKSIGSVECENGMFQIRLDKEYREGLTAIEGFAYLQVLWWADKVDRKELREITVLDKPYRKGPDRIGVFATRSPVRPNPLALSAVAVIGIDREKGIITVPYLDAEPGTPVLDIKPYQPCTERIREAGVPGWCAHWPEWYEDSAAFDWAGEFNF